MKGPVPQLPARSASRPIVPVSFLSEGLPPMPPCFSLLLTPYSLLLTFPGVPVADSSRRLAMPKKPARVCLRIVARGCRLGHPRETHPPAGHGSGRRKRRARRLIARVGLRRHSLYRQGGFCPLVSAYPSLRGRIVNWPAFCNVLVGLIVASRGCCLRGIALRSFSLPAVLRLFNRSGHRDRTGRSAAPRASVPRCA